MLKVDESSLTGESEPVELCASAVLDEDAPLGDRVNMVTWAVLCRTEEALQS